MEQPKGFFSSQGEHLVCKLKKSIYGLKQASRKWYLKFHDVISSFGFEENIMDHWRAAKKVLRYLQGMKKYMLMYRQTDNLEIIGYSYSDFVGCVDSYKSTAGYIFMFVGGAVSWRGAKQTSIATSTMEVEFVSCFEATLYGVWMKSFIFGLRIVVSISKPLKLFCDNSATVSLAKNNKSGSRSKHIDIKCLSIREYVKDKTMVIEHVSTELKIVDPLTKGMPLSKFNDHIDHMGLGLLM